MIGGDAAVQADGDELVALAERLAVGADELRRATSSPVDRAERPARAAGRDDGLGADLDELAGALAGLDRQTADALDAVARRLRAVADTTSSSSSTSTTSSSIDGAGGGPGAATTPGER